MSCSKDGTRQTISSICSELGFPVRDGQDAFHELLPEAREELGDAADDFVDPMEAGAELRAIVRSIPVDGDEEATERTMRLRDQIINATEKGRIRFTKAEMLALSRMPAHLEVNRAMGAVDGEEHIALVEQRKCELCGEFIGVRVAHVGCAPNEKWERNVTDHAFGSEFGYTKPSLRKVDLKEGEDVVPVAAFSGEGEIPGFAKNIRTGGHGGYDDVGRYLKSGRASVDEYFATPLTERGLLVRDAIIMNRLRDKAIGRGLVCKVPREIPLGVADDPSQATQRGIYVLAQWGKDEFTSVQMKRMMTVGGLHAAEPLLAAPRTRAKALKLLRTEPGLAKLRRELAVKGYLDSADVTGLASSPDVEDQVAAVRSPNLHQSERLRLARSGKTVSLVLARTREMANNEPEIFRALLQHPSVEVRKAAAQTGSYSSDPILASESDEVLEQMRKATEQQRKVQADAIAAADAAAREAERELRRKHDEEMRILSMRVKQGQKPRIPRKEKESDLKDAAKIRATKLKNPDDYRK